MTTPADAFYDHHDALGSVTNVTDSAGTSEWTDSYEPFGAVKTETQDDPAAPASPVKFTGQYQDSAAGLYHLRARQYDPASGRFLGLDPAAAPASAPGMSAYTYASDGPTAATDPAGLFCVSWRCSKSAISSVASGVGGLVESGAGAGWSADKQIGNVIGTAWYEHHSPSAGA